MKLTKIIHTLALYIIGSSQKRGDYIRKHNIFGACGSDVRISAGRIPAGADYIVLHNNIEIASGARLVPHDAIHGVFSRMDGNKYPEHLGKIEIFDNVFIGTNAVIIGPVQIGPNAIVAAGAVVNSDVKEGTIVGGVPAKVIGDFYSLKNKRMAKQQGEI